MAHITHRKANQIGLFSTEEWNVIVSYSSPTTLRSLACTSKGLNKIVNLYRIAIVVNNSELHFENPDLDCAVDQPYVKLFPEKLVTKLKSKEISLSKKINKLKQFIDTRAIVYMCDDHMYTCKLFHHFAAIKPNPTILNILLKLGTTLNASLFGDYIWNKIVSYSHPITIRSFSIVNKSLARIVKLFRIALVLENKELCFEISHSESCQSSVKLFDNSLIAKLESKEFSLNEKTVEIKKYVDTKTILSDKLLCFFSDKEADPNIFELLLKLGPNLDFIADSYKPTALFRACNIYGQVDFVRTAELIEAGADFRIWNPDRKTCFQEYRYFHPNANNIDITLLEGHAQRTWKKLKRTSAPIPEKKYLLEGRKQINRRSCPSYSRMDFSYDPYHLPPDLTVFENTTSTSQVNPSNQSPTHSLESPLYYSRKPHRNYSFTPTNSSEHSLESPFYAQRKSHRNQPVSSTHSSEVSFESPNLPHKIPFSIDSIEFAHQPTISKSRSNITATSSGGLSYVPTLSASRSNITPSNSGKLVPETTILISQSNISSISLEGLSVESSTPISTTDTVSTGETEQTKK